MWIWECALKGRGRLATGSVLSGIEGFLFDRHVSFSELRGLSPDEAV